MTDQETTTEPRATVYGLSERWIRLMDRMEVASAHGLDDEVAEIHAEIEALDISTSDKIQRMAGGAMYFAAYGAEIAAESKRLAERAKSLAAISQRLRWRIGYLMDISQITSSKDRYVVSYVKPKPSVELDEAETLPLKYLVAQDPKPDKRAIKAALDSGESVNGAKLVLGKATARIK